MLLGRKEYSGKRENEWIFDGYRRLKWSSRWTLKLIILGYETCSVLRVSKWLSYM